MESNVECPVCFQINTEPIKLKCNHIFCLSCIEKILYSDVHRCPMDRSVFEFKKDLSIDESTLLKVKEAFPEEYAILIQKNQENLNEKNIQECAIEYGNYHKMSDNQQNNCHEWKVFVRIGKSNSEIRKVIDSLRGKDSENTEEYEIKDSEVIERVTFYLHPTFRPSKIVIDSPPFSLRRIGWGVFNITMIVDFQPQLCIDTIELNHFLSFSRSLKKETKYITIDLSKELVNN